MPSFFWVKVPSAGEGRRSPHFLRVLLSAQTELCTDEASAQVLFFDPSHAFHGKATFGLFLKIGSEGIHLTPFAEEICLQEDLEVSLVRLPVTVHEITFPPMPSCCKRGTQKRCKATHKRNPSMASSPGSPGHVTVLCENAQRPLPLSLCRLATYHTRRIHPSWIQSRNQSESLSPVAAKGNRKQCSA